MHNLPRHTVFNQCLIRICVYILAFICNFDYLWTGQNAHQLNWVNSSLFSYYSNGQRHLFFTTMTDRQKAGHSHNSLNIRRFVCFPGEKTHFGNLVTFLVFYVPFVPLIVFCKLSQSCSALGLIKVGTNWALNTKIAL